MHNNLTYISFFYFTYFIVIHGFIKTNFASKHDQKLNKLIGCGAVTDGTFKLEVHIINFNLDAYLDLDLKKGDKIELVGIMQNTGTIFCILQNKNIHTHYYF